MPYPMGKGRDFSKLKTALVEYDAVMESMKAKWGTIRTDDDAQALMDECLTALTRLRLAFLECTKDVNTWSHAKVTDVNYLRQCVKKWEEENQ